MLRRPLVLLWTVLIAMAAALFIYSQTMAFVWDEGFHLVAAQLIAWGRTPYIDFAFPQTLLNAYFNALILQLFGPSWRAVHAFDAAFVIAAVCLAATFTFRRFPEIRWRLSCAVVVACLIAFHTVVIAFGPVAQAYGSGMFLSVAAFRVAVASRDRRSILLAALSALLAGMAAGSTLLTLPVVPVLLGWLLWEERSSGVRKLLKLTLAFAIASAIPFIPEILLLIRAPQQTFFNVVRYQAIFRRVNWGDVNSHDFDVFTDWTASGDAFLLGFFFLVGLLFVWKRSAWSAAARSEFYLAAALALSLALYIATAHPTFGRYFIFVIPFGAIVAGAGFYYTASRLLSENRPRWAVAFLAFVLAAGAAKYVFDDRDATNWHDYRKMADKIREVTPRGREYMADEHIYFLLHEAPPSAMEFSYSHKIQLSPSEERLYHTISLQELKQQIARGRFATVETCKDEIIDDFELEKHLPNKQDFDDCSVFWRNK